MEHHSEVNQIEAARTRTLGIHFFFILEARVCEMNQLQEIVHFN